MDELEEIALGTRHLFDRGVVKVVIVEAIVGVVADDAIDLFEKFGLSPSTWDLLRDNLYSLFSSESEPEDVASSSVTGSSYN